MNCLLKFLSCFLIMSISWNALSQDNTPTTSADETQVQKNAENNNDSGTTTIKPTKYVKPTNTTNTTQTNQNSLKSDSGNKIFDKAFDKLYLTFTSSRVIVYALAAFGLLGFAVAAIFGKLSWLWLTIIAVSLFVLASAEAVISYTVRAGKGSPGKMTASWASQQFNKNNYNNIQFRDDSNDFNYEEILKSGSKVKK